MKIKLISLRNFVLCVMLSCSSLSVFAGNQITQQKIDLVVDVAPVCDLSLNSQNISFSLLTNVPNVMGTSLIIDCTPETAVTLSVSSANNWNLLGKLYAKLIPYTLAYVGGSNSNGTIAPTWSGNANNYVVMNGISTALPWQIPIEVSVQNINNQLAIDNYVDVVTINLSY